MYRKITLIILLISLLAIPVVRASAQAAETTYIELIVDASDSMKREVDAATKLDTTVTALVNFINGAPPNYQFALRIMGGDANASEYASELAASMGQMSKFSLIEKLRELKPLGKRSLYQALYECLYDFPQEDGNNIVMLITDGLDEGGQSLSDLETAFVNTPGAPRVYVFGLDITEAMKTELNSITKAAGGKIISLDKPSSLEKSLTDALSEFQGNLSVYIYDKDGRPINGDIIVNDAQGQPVKAAYDAAMLITDVPEGLYTVEATYKDEKKTSEPIAVGKGAASNIKFVFSTINGNVRVTVLDSMLDALKANLKIRDMYYQTVYEGGPASDFNIALPEGTYEIEASSGDRVQTEYGVVLTGEDTIDVEIVVPLTQSVLEIEVNNLQSSSINSDIKIYTLDGYLMGEVEYASSYTITLPPDTYVVSVDAAGQHKEETVFLPEGDQTTVNIDIDIQMGYLLVGLKTESGNDVWGMVKVYDEHGEYSRHWSLETSESPEWSFELPEGVYRVEANVAGVVSSRDGVRVDGGQETRIELTFPDSTR